MRSFAASVVGVLLLAGCAGNGSPMGTTSLVPFDPAAAVGTWALTDDRNVTFNVILREDGSAVSTWSRGSDGAHGERGGWSVRDGALQVRWTDGWLDTIRVGRFGFEKLSFGPAEREGDNPTSFGQAVKITDDAAQWIGVWRTCSVGADSKGQELFVCLSSDGNAVKSLDAINTGSWEQQATGVVIYWSDGWFTSLTRGDSAVQGQSWAPGADRKGEPAGTETWTEVTE